MSGLEIAPLVMSVLPPAMEYFFAQEAAVSMDDDENIVHQPSHKAPTWSFPVATNINPCRHDDDVKKLYESRACHLSESNE